MNSIFCLFLMTTSVFGNDPIIDLPTGTIRGKVIGNNCSDYSCPSSCPFYSYTEIPFGQPPVGPLRFQAPKPVKSWTGVLDCTESRKLCFNVYGSFPYETEDCLLLNVYTPVPPCMRTKLPVLFQIYGGGFMNGVATFDALGPHYFMRENLVVVTTYYRIGPWGFLSTGDKVIPGNAGLKDQCLALKWVQTNIHLFGGDPRKVTVMGVSAGAASATYQLLSRRCGGTFRAAIALSGSALNPWAYQRHHVEVAYQVANNINPLFQRNNSTKEMFTFLQTVSNADLKNASLNIRLSYTDQMAQGFYFAPVTEVDNESAFLNRKMYGLLETGSFNRVPILMGISSEEELYRYADTNNFKLYMQTFDSNPRLLVPEDMHVTNDTEKLALGQIIRKLYTGGLLADDLIASVKYFSDTCFNRPLIRYAQLQSTYTDVYFYQFSYYGKLSRTTFPQPEGLGKSSHTADANYLWVLNGNDDLLDYPESDILTSKRYVKMYSNFVKFLNPTPDRSELLQQIKWLKMEPDLLNYLDIDSNLTMKINPKSEHYFEWVHLYNKYGKKPFDTY